MILDFVEEKIKVKSISYKLSNETKKLRAFKIKYASKIKTTLIKAKDETDDNLQTFSLKK